MDPKKILIVQLGRLGDLVLMTPMFEAIKRDNPRHEIHLLCGRRNNAFAATLPNITGVHTYKKTLPGLLRLLVQLRAEKFDCWIDAKDHYSGESARFARWVGAPLTIGFNRENRRPVFTQSLVNEHSHQRRHFVDRNLDALAHLLGTIDVPRRPHLTVDPDSESKLTAFLADLGVVRYALVNVSAGSKSRYWPVHHWIALIRAFPDTTFLINSEAADVPLAQSITASCSNAHHFPTRSFLDAIALVRHAALLITPDTSLIHVASAFDTPTVGMYHNTESIHTFWTPLSQHHRILRGEEITSITDISVEAVTEAVASITRADVPFPVPDG